MKRRQVDEVFDAFLRSTGEQTLEELYDKYIEEFPEDVQEELPELDKKMRKIFRKAKAREKGTRTARYVRRIAVLLIATLSIGGLGIMHVDAWRVSFSNFVLEVTGGKISLDIGGNQAARQDRMLPENVKIPEYLPPGFELGDIMQFKSEVIMEFTNNSQTITFDQAVLSEMAYNEFSHEEDNELVKINGWDGQIINLNGLIKIIWRDELNVYRITGSLERDQLVKMAESIK